MIAFFPRNIHWSSFFARKARVNTKRVPPGHPIILLKSIKFKMADVAEKRSISVFFFLRSCEKQKGNRCWPSFFFSGILTGTAIETVTETGEWVTFYLTLQLPKVFKKATLEHLQILVCEILNVKKLLSSFHLNGNALGFHPHVQKLDPPHRKVLPSSFHLNGATLGFHSQTQKLETPCTA